MAYPIVVIEDSFMDKSGDEGKSQLKAMEIGVFVDSDDAKNGKISFYIKQPSGTAQVIRTGLQPLMAAITDATLNRDEA